jgi:hypothetical protein
MKAHFPDWDITKSLQDTFEEIHEAGVKRKHAAGEKVYAW